jgi:hypothetical protein
MYMVWLISNVKMYRQPYGLNGNPVAVWGVSDSMFKLVVKSIAIAKPTQRAKLFIGVLQISLHQKGISISGKSRPSHLLNAIGRALVSITSISISFCAFSLLSAASACVRW